MSFRNNRITRNKKSNTPQINNKIIIAIIIIILIIVLIIMFNKLSSSNKTQQISSTEQIPYKYFILVSGENIGVVDKTGNLVIETDYSSIDIPNPSKDVFICSKDDETDIILNKDKQTMFLEYEQVQAVKSSDEINEIEKYVLKYKENDLYGLIDLEGNTITEAIYEEIASLDYRPGRILVKKDDKYGVLDSFGNIIVEIKYDNISADGYCSEDDLYDKTGYIVAKKTTEGMYYGYINYKGDIILDTKYETIERAFEYDEDNIYLIAMQNGKKGVFKNKKNIIKLDFQNVTYTAPSNVFIVNKNGKYGFYNTDGKVILNAEYTGYSIAGNYISVIKDSEGTSLYDINGNLVNSSGYTKMIETENPSYFIAEDEEGYYSIISKDVKIEGNYTSIQYAFDNYFIFTNANGNAGVINAITQDVEIEPQYDFIILIDKTNVLQAIDGINNKVEIYSKDLEKTLTMEDGIVDRLNDEYLVVYSQTDIKYIDANGKLVENTEVYTDLNLYAVQKNGKWGFANTNGDIVIECKYDIVTEFNEYGFAGIKKDGKWGVVNEKGEVIVEPSYELDTYYFPEFIGKYLLLQSEFIYCEEILL